MAVKSLKETTGSREGALSINNEKETIITGTRTFIVITDDVYTNVKDINGLSSAPASNSSDDPYPTGENTTIPKLGSVHNINESEIAEFDVKSSYRLPVCYDISWAVIEEDARLVFKYVCSYTNDLQYQPKVALQSIIAFDWKTYEYVADKGYAHTDGKVKTTDPVGKPSITIENSAQKQFNPPHMKEVNNTLIKIAQYYPVKDISLKLQLKNSINDVDQTIAGIEIKAGEGKITDMDMIIERKFEKYFKGNESPKLINYALLTFTIEINTENWFLKPLNLGYKDIDNKPYDAKASNSDTQYKLDKSGEFVENQTEPAIELEFLLYPAYDDNNWTTLDLPEQIAGTEDEDN